MISLPPHTTHALQPLDVAVFKSLKDSFAKSVRALSFTKKNLVVSKRRVVKRPLDQAFCIFNIKSGFSKCGIYPFNPDAVAKNKMKPSSVYGVGSSLSNTSPVLILHHHQNLQRLHLSCPISPLQHSTQQVVANTSVSVAVTPTSVGESPSLQSSTVVFSITSPTSQGGTVPSPVVFLLHLRLPRVVLSHHLLLHPLR